MCFREHLVNVGENLQILPMGNVRHFRRIHKKYGVFLKMCAFRENVLNLCVFREHLVSLCVSRGNLVNPLENLQVLPMGSMCHFRRIREHDTLFLKMCVFRILLVNYWGNLQILPMGNVRHFRRIHKHDILFLKMCVFRRNLVISAKKS